MSQIAPLKSTIAVEVLLNESQALLKLSESLDNRFDQAIDLILETTGRVIVSGMGKSGHVSKKIVSTLSSTGQPSLFIHPGEASHGDLGMIARGDILILLSNSGETRELSHIIDYARRFSIPTIGITAKKSSNLASVVTIPLILPDFPEACPMGLAPTTSTTMMMALGDAIAIALLSAKGFSNKDFKLFHPGGNLGNQLMHVKDCMHQGDKVPLVKTETGMNEVIILMTSCGFGCAGVINEQSELVGVITDGDLRRHMSTNLLEKTAVQIMTANPVAISPDTLMAEALAILNQKSITSLFVIDDKADIPTPCGIIHIHDFLRLGIA